MLSEDLIKKLIDEGNIDISKFKDYYGDNYLTYYSIIYSKYRYCLELLMENKYHISKLDKYFTDSSLNYEKLDSSKDDIYKRTSYMKYNYYYFRNDLYLDKLNKEDLDLILRLNLSNKEDLLKLINIVSNSYKDIITLNNSGSYLSVTYAGLNPDKSYLDGNICYVFRYIEPLDLFDENPTFFDQMKDISDINQMNSKEGLSLVYLNDNDFIKDDYFVR